MHFISNKIFPMLSNPVFPDFFWVIAEVEYRVRENYIV